MTCVLCAFTRTCTAPKTNTTTTINTDTHETLLPTPRAVCHGLLRRFSPRADSLKCGSSRQSAAAHLSVARLVPLYAFTSGAARGYRGGEPGVFSFEERVTRNKANGSAADRQCLPVTDGLAIVAPLSCSNIQILHAGLLPMGSSWNCQLRGGAHHLVQWTGADGIAGSWWHGYTVRQTNALRPAM